MTGKICLVQELFNKAAGSQEFESNTVVVKDLSTGVQTSVTRTSLVQEVSRVLESKT